MENKRKRIGLSVNAPLDHCDILKRIGFDYIEPSNTDIMQMSLLEFQKVAEKMENCRVHCSVIDNPIPCSVSFSAPEWDINQWIDYLDLSGLRAQRLGAKYWCIGNGTSRMIQEDKGKMIDVFFSVVDYCAAIGEKYGLHVIVEPLGPSVTNYLNSVEETATFVQAINRKNVHTMVDFRWEYEQNRPIADLYQYADLIVHAHIDNPNTDYKNLKIRRVQSLNDGVDYTEFMRFLGSDCFSGIVSIEANTFSDYEMELAGAIEFYKKYNVI